MTARRDGWSRYMKQEALRDPEARRGRVAPSVAAEARHKLHEPISVHVHPVAGRMPGYQAIYDRLIHKKT